MHPNTGSHSSLQWPVDRPERARSRSGLIQESHPVLVHLPAEVSATAPVPAVEEAKAPAVNMQRVRGNLEMLGVLFLSLLLAWLMGG